MLWSDGAAKPLTNGGCLLIVVIIMPPSNAWYRTIDGVAMSRVRTRHSIGVYIISQREL